MNPVLFSLFFLLFSLCTNLFAASKIYRYTDANGVLHLTTTPPEQSAPVAESEPPPTVLHLHNQGGEPQITQQPYQAPTLAAPAAPLIDQALLRAVIEVESNWNPRAVSPKGATGLMQLMPSTAAQYGKINLYDPLENLQVGVQHLDYLMKKFNGDLTLVLAAYNAGEGAVKKYGGVPPYPETQAYVEKVLKLYRRYQLKTP